MSELKPCPFCGGSNLEVVNMPQGYFIDCSCGCFTGDFETEAEAIDAWNTRAQIPGEVCETEGHGELGPLPVVEERTCHHNKLFGRGYYFVCSECGWNLPNVGRASIELAAALIRYCPGCGAKVVE